MTDPAKLPPQPIVAPSVNTAPKSAPPTPTVDVTPLLAQPSPSDSFTANQFYYAAESKMIAYGNALDKLAEASPDTGPDAQAKQDEALKEIDKAVNPAKYPTYTITYVNENPPTAAIMNAAAGAANGAVQQTMDGVEPTIVYENPPKPPAITGFTFTLPIIQGTVEK